MIDPRHPLLVLESHMPWQEIETALGRRFERQTVSMFKVILQDRQC